MPFRIKGLTINLRPLAGRTFRLPGLSVGLVLVLLLLSVGVFFYLSPTKIWWGIKDKIPEIDWRFLLGKLVIERPTKEKEELPALEIKLPEPKKKEYREVAEPGESITHLARKALKKYLQEKPQDFEITPEHKIYIEDYIQKKTGSGWLMLGETLTFSEDLIVEAINKARELNPDQLENLKQYSTLVTNL